MVRRGSENLIRYAKEGDFESIYQLSKKNSDLLGFVMPIEIRQHIRRLECIVDEDNNFIKGFVLFHLLKNNSYLSIYTICVDENNRGQHIASNMVNFIQKKYNRDIRTTCIKDSSSELFWASIAKKIDESPGKKRPICRYLIRCNRRKLINGI